MPLGPGSRVDAYELICPLGSGGMGEVWLATEVHLRRKVALKLLPSELTRDTTRVTRFEQEARAASVLNHPNVCVIYALGMTADGQHYIAMEYVAGHTLRARPVGERLTIREALDIAIQIASALTAAHTSGIVHRDIKPENVMLRPDGFVKVLDFGLAKLMSTAEARQPTQTAFRTDAGSVVGTVDYMSPEQARGQQVDSRTDIWSLGVMLYEMVAGRCPFTGQSRSEVLAAILDREPPPLARFDPEAPPELQRIVGKALRKDRSQRYQTVQDLLLDLQALREDIQSHTRLGSTPVTPITTEPVISGSSQTVAPAPSRRRRVGLTVAAAALVIGAMAGVWALRTARLAPTVGTDVAPPTLVPLTSLAGDEMRPALSPDGTQVAFFWGGERNDDGGVYVTIIGSPEIRRVTKSPKHDNFVEWSPDGRFIAFARYNFADYAGARIHMVSPLGGSAPRLSDFPAAGPLSWSADGRYIAASRSASNESRDATGIFLVPVNGGVPRPVTHTRAPSRDTAVAFSPDGHQLAYASCTPECDVYILRLDAGLAPVGPPKRITTQNLYVIENIAWTSDGQWIIYDSLLARGISYLSRVNANGGLPPERIELAGLNTFGPGTARSSGSRVVFSRSFNDVDIFRFQPGGSTEPIVASSFGDYDPQFSPEGERIVFTSDRSGQASELWIADADGSNAQRLLNGPGWWQSSPHWSPNGREIAFESVGEDGRFHVWKIDARGGVPIRVTARTGSERFPTWSRDSRSIYFAAENGGEWDIWRTTANDGALEQVTRTGNAWKGFELPEGKSLVYQARFAKRGAQWDPSGNTPVFVASLGGRPVELVECARAGSLNRGPGSLTGGPTEFIYADCGWSGDGVPVRAVNIATGETRLIGTLKDYSDASSIAVRPFGTDILYGRYRGIGVDLFMIENFK